jgi:hypothetical protein
MVGLLTSTTSTSTRLYSFVTICTSNIGNVIKVKASAKHPPTTIFAKATDLSYGLMPYIGMINHFQDYGMDAIFNFSTYKGILVNNLNGHL